MLQFANSQFRYSPYPLAVIRPALDPEFYAELVRTFPGEELFGKLPKYDYKLSLSEKINRDAYRRFIDGTPAWRRLHGWIKSEDFIRAVVRFLAAQNVDLDLDEYFTPTGKRLAIALGKVARGQIPSGPGRLRTRFEFSVLRADGGEVAPHTDTPRKIITLVVSMIAPGEWPVEFGGGLEIDRAIDDAYAFNWKNRIVPWDSMQAVETIPFVPNQCMIFVKTFNSLHSVRPMTQAGSKALRKTITIVIEKDD